MGNQLQYQTYLFFAFHPVSEHQVLRHYKVPTGAPDDFLCPEKGNIGIVVAQ